jgi:hypothetical protein
VELVFKNILDDGKVRLRLVRRLLKALEEAVIKEGLGQGWEWKIKSEAVEYYIIDKE